MPFSPTSNLIPLNIVLTETIRTELTATRSGVKVLLVAPGSFPTEGIYNNPYFTEAPVPANNALRAASIKAGSAIPGSEPNDPVKGMELVVDVVRGEGHAKDRPFPEYLIIGKDAMTTAERKANKILQACRDWEDLTGEPILREGFNGKK